MRGFGLLCCVLLAVPAHAAEPDIIRFATINSNYRVALEEIIRRYEERNPHLKVELSIVAQEFATWIRTRVAAGGDLVPDIYNGNYTNGYDRQGRWVALDPHLESINPYTESRWLDGLDGRDRREARVAAQNRAHAQLIVDARGLRARCATAAGGRRRRCRP